MSAKPSFRKGVDEVDKAGTASSRFQREVFFSIEDGEVAILRFVTPEDEWITVDQYGFLPTKEAPKGFTGNWPSKMPAVSRQDPAFVGMFEDDYVAEHMRDSNGKPYRPSPRTWALACLREEVIEDGRLVGYRDKTREVEVEEDGKKKTITEKAIVIVNLGYKNFFGKLTGFAKVYGTILDRDYHIRRRGSGPRDTDYIISPLDPIPVADDKPGIEGKDGRRYYDLRHPEIAARYEYHTTLEDIVTHRASDEYYHRFFDKRVTVVDGDNEKNGDGEKSEGAPAKQQVKPSDEIDSDSMQAMRERIMGYKSGGSESESAPAAAGGLRNFDDE